MPEIKIDGGTLFVEMAGDGPPLVMLAGLASDCLSWEPIKPFLAERFRLIMPDNRGAGRTTLPYDGVTLPRMAADVLAVLDALGIERAPVLGHSMGGLIALDAAAAAPGRLGPLVLTASAPLPNARNMAVFDSLIALRQNGVSPQLWLPVLFTWLFRKSWFAQPGAVEEAIRLALAHPYPQSDAAFTAQIEAVRAYRPPAALKDLRARVLAVLGNEDLLFAPQAALDALARYPGFELSHRFVEDAGHSLHWDQPEAVASAVTAFLE